MNTLNTAYQTLTQTCPAHYYINEVMPFNYPYRHLRVPARVDKAPEQDLQKIYDTLLRAVQLGYNSKAELAHFLGLRYNDTVLSELDLLQSKRYLHHTFGALSVTSEGEDYLHDHSILKVEEQITLDLLKDERTGDVLPLRRLDRPNDGATTLPSDTRPNRSAELLSDCTDAIRELRAATHPDEHLIELRAHEIEYDKTVSEGCILVEYHPCDVESGYEPYIEVRNSKGDFVLNRHLTSILQDEYPDIAYLLSDSDRIKLLGEYREALLDAEPIHRARLTVEKLSVWETKDAFRESLRTVKRKILIESPWIGRATQTYLPFIEDAIGAGKKVVILYGIDEYDQHDPIALGKLQSLADRSPNLLLYYLPEHFAQQGVRLTGTHRKRLVKDEDYVISGSFNFLSFNKKTGQRIANEESYKMSGEAREEWRKVNDEYRLGLPLQ